MSLRRRWNALWNPENYHGWNHSSNFFEGWYYKLVSKDEGFAVAVIVGISKTKAADNHAFIQLLDGVQCIAEYHYFEESDFQMSADRFELNLGGNRFSKDGFSLKMPDLEAEIKFKGRTDWPKYLWAPGIMGWYSFVPFMQCYHAIISLDHQISGSMLWKEKKMEFDKGRGYSEKDWGTSFPKCWIWMQCNHFSSKDPISCTASVAHIPWMGHFFVGFIVGFYFEGKVYRFATYTGAKMKASIQNEEIHLSFAKGTTRLEIMASKNSGAELFSPIEGAMVGKIEESLRSEMEIKFYLDKQLVFNDKGRNAGLEIAGDVRELLTEEWRS